MPGKILVVDDDPALIRLLHSKLTEQGYEVESAGDGQEALAKYRDFQPDLIILDILMPGMDGYTFVLEFKKIGDLKMTPIIILTSRPSMREIFAIEGINDYIIKPFKTEDLLRKIEKRMTAKGKKILVVDDEPEVVDVIKSRLTRNGYDVITAYNGMEGLEVAKKERPDLIVLDVMMPKLDGYHVCRMLKFDQKYRNISIVVLSALAAQEENILIAKQVGADACLAKPYDGNVLLQTIKELLWD